MSVLSDPYTLIATISLIVQIAVLFLLILGYSYKRKLKFRQHGTIMATAVVLHLIMIFALMIPSFVLAVVPQYILRAPLMLVSLVGLIHGVAGVAAFVLGVWLVLAWRFRKDISGCIKRKKFMLPTLSIWIIALLLGIILYAIFYGPILFN